MSDKISPCVVCGESVTGSPYVSLEMFFVGDEMHRGIFMEPDEPVTNFGAWRDVPHRRCVHMSCVQNYLEGVLADARHRIGS